MPYFLPFGLYSEIIFFSSNVQKSASLFFLLGRDNLLIPSLADSFFSPSPSSPNSPGGEKLEFLLSSRLRKEGRKAISSPPFLMQRPLGATEERDGGEKYGICQSVKFASGAICRGNVAGGNCPQTVHNETRLW